MNTCMGILLGLLVGTVAILLHVQRKLWSKEEELSDCKSRITDLSSNCDNMRYIISNKNDEIYQLSGVMRSYRNKYLAANDLSAALVWNIVELQDKLAKSEEDTSTLICMIRRERAKVSKLKRKLKDKE